VPLANTWAIPAMLFGDPWIFMCEGSRVKMGYVTYGVGGKKKSETKLRLKNIEEHTRGERQEA